MTRGHFTYPWKEEPLGMARQRASHVSAVTVAALLAMLWSFPAVWCIERDGNIKIKAAVPCTASSPHCPSDTEAAPGTDCHDVTVYVDGLTRLQLRAASVQAAFYPPMINSTTDVSFRCCTSSHSLYLAYTDRSTAPAGPDLTIVLLI